MRMFSRLYQTEGDIALNLAVEETLLETAGQEEAILFLWSNPAAVVIGRNQNPWKECHLTAMQESGCSLARRKTGGGAVYQDEGNLNYSFIINQEICDPAALCGIVTKALARLGLSISAGGRNDLQLPDGRKVSGLAYRDLNGKSLVHGTLMIDVDLDQLERCLRVPEEKLHLRGIDSVRRRVANLKEMAPQVTPALVREAISHEWNDFFGQPATEVPVPQSELIRQRTDFYRSEEWTYGRKMPFSLNWKGQYDWGLVCLHLQVDHGLIRQAQAETDSLDTLWVRRLCQSLNGTLLLPGLIESRIRILMKQDPERSRIYADVGRLIRDRLG